MIKSYFRVLSPLSPGSQAIRSLWCFWLGRHASARDVSELHKGLHPAPRLHPTTPTASRPTTRSRYIQSVLGVGALQNASVLLLCLCRRLPLSTAQCEVSRCGAVRMQPVLLLEGRLARSQLRWRPRGFRTNPLGLWRRGLLTESHDRGPSSASLPSY